MRSQLLFKLILLICLPLALALACHAQRQLFPDSSAERSSTLTVTPELSSTPKYTPAVFQTGAPLPASTEAVVGIEELLANPERYKDQYILVQGFNMGMLAQLECENWAGPKPEWGLYSELPIYQNNEMANAPEMLYIVNLIPDSYERTDSCGQMVKAPDLKRVAVWGWLREYDALLGCLLPNEAGTPEVLSSGYASPFWYLQAAQLQFLEDVNLIPPNEYHFCTPVPPSTYTDFYALTETARPTVTITVVTPFSP